MLSVGPQHVLRAGGTRGEFVSVRVPHGFPVYVHGDLVDLDLDSQQVDVVGERVNLRLLPATVGLPAVGQVSADDGPLVLLDQEGEWVRVLAPESLVLFAPAAGIEPAPEADARADWDEYVASREARRRARLAFHRATDPDWQREEAVARDVEALVGVDVAALDEDGLATHRARLDELAGRARRASTLARIERQAELARQESDARAQALATLEELKRARAEESARVAREARILDLGLRFLGQGTPLEVEGVVRRATAEDQEASVYSVRDGRGQSFKLSLAAELGDLSDLLGRRVRLAGRNLPLRNVQGEVLVVDSFELLEGAGSDAR